MVETSEKIIIDYLLSSNRGEIVQKNDRDTNFIKIGEKQYRYDKNKPISDRLKTKLNKVKQTTDYKRHELVEKKDAKWLNVDKNKALIKIQGHFKAKISEEQSAFKNYANSYSITDIRPRGIKGISYIRFQEPQLKRYIQQNNGMKLLMEMIATFRSKKTGEDITHTTRTRLYNITNNDELQHALNQMGTDLEIQMEKMEISESGLVLKQINKLKIHYDKYNPTCGGSFIELPGWVKKKKACINIQNEDNKCFKYAVQCGLYKIL